MVHSRVIQALALAVTKNLARNIIRNKAKRAFQRFSWG
jgi:hypothetical protein